MYVMTSCHLFSFSSVILSISVVPDFIVPSSKGLLENMCWYASYRLFDSSVRPGTYYVQHPIVVVVIDLPLLRVAVEGSDNPVSLEKPCQASLPPDQQGRHSLGRHPEVQYVA